MNEPNFEKIRGMSAGQFLVGLEGDIDRLSDQWEFDNLLNRTLPIDGEREGGPLRFESTPQDGANPFYEKFFNREAE
jgi:hypothetical protein